jgi:hypothetical protein
MAPSLPIRIANRKHTKKRGGPRGRGTAGEIITPAIQVVALDTLGNTDVNFTGAVTVTLSANPTGAFLDGTRTIAAVSGVASFGDVVVDRAGTGYTLRATASGATAATSNGFNIATAVR